MRMICRVCGKEDNMDVPWDNQLKANEAFYNTCEECQKNEV